MNTIFVNCTNCSKKLPEIVHIPGVQELKCQKCNRVTIVKISEKGHLTTSLKSKCRLATIVCSKLDLPLSCPELTALTAWCETHLSQSQNGKRLLAEYELSCRRLVPLLEAVSDRGLFEHLHKAYVEPAALAAAHGDTDGAVAEFRKLVRYLTDRMI